MKLRKVTFAARLAALGAFALCASNLSTSAPAQNEYIPNPTQGAGDQAYHRRGEEASAIITQARQLARARDFEGAKALYLRGAQLDPNEQSAMLHNNLAACLESLADWDAAAEEYKKALAFDPSLELAKKNFANNRIQRLSAQAKALMSETKYDEALQCYADALQIDPSRAMSHNNLATAYHAKGDLDSAINQYKQALAIEPQMDLATINIARSYYNEGKFSEARQYFSKYAEEHPQGKDANEARTSLARIEKVGSASEVQDSDGPDYFKSTTARALIKWPPGTPITVSIASGEGVPGFEPEFRQAMIESFNQWSQATNHRVAWVFAQKGTAPAIDCQWTGNNSSFSLHGSNPDEQGEVSTYNTFVKDGQKYIKHTTILISTLNTKNGKFITEAEARDVCLHEVGHALGLVGHSPNYHDIMFFVTNPGGGSILRSLSQRDIATINRLYDGYPVQQTN